MSAATPGPSAASITVAQTLALLDGPHVAVARAVANGRYVFWLGSGISRGRVHGLDGVVERVLEFLQQKAAHEGSGSPHLRALEDAIELADLRTEERARIDLSKAVASWPDRAVLVNSLVGGRVPSVGVRARRTEEVVPATAALMIVGRSTVRRLGGTTGGR